MAVNKSFNGTTYSIPTTAGENGWTSLTNFLQALADYAAVKTTKVQAIRTATTSPVTVSATSDFAINVALSVAGVSTVTLPVGASGQVFCIIDGNGDSATYNITVQGSSSQTINGASTYVMASNKQVAIFQFNGTEWKVIAEYLGASINATKIGGGSVSNTEFGYLDGVTSAIQTQIDSKAAASGGTLTSPTLVTPALGTPTSGTLANCTGLPVVAGTTGTLSVARGGTGLTALGSANQVLRVNAGATALEYASVGSGDVVGPASATDNAIARFDSTTGKLIQNSGATVDDSNQVSAASFTATGGTAANNTMYVASNALRLRGGTSGLSFFNTSGTETFNVSDVGALTLGPASGSSLTHTIRSGGGTTLLNLTSSAGAYSTQIKFNATGGGNGSILIPSGGAFTFRNNTDTTDFGRIETTGAWTLGNSSSTTGRHVIQNNVNSDQTLKLINAGNSSPNGLAINYSAVDPNNTGAEFLYCTGVATLRAAIRSNGGLANYSANNVNLSDIRTKEGIVPAGSYYEKVKSLEIVRFHYKDQNSKTDEDLNLGVVAQQVLEVMPEVVDEGGFDPNAETKLLAIYDTDLMFASIKALQEAMTKIESLQARIEALENP